MWSSYLRAQHRVMLWEIAGLTCLGGDIWYRGTDTITARFVPNLPTDQRPATLPGVPTASQGARLVVQQGSVAEQDILTSADDPSMRVRVLQKTTPDPEVWKAEVLR